MQYLDNKKVTINVDNQSAISLAKNPVFRQRTKHIDIKYHYIRSQIKENLIELKYIPSELNVADIFTKPVSSHKINRFKIFNMD